MKKNAGQSLADRGYMPVKDAVEFKAVIHAQSLVTERNARIRAIGELCSSTPAIRDAALVRMERGLR